MKTLWSVAVFGLVPIPHGDVAVGASDHSQATGENNNRSPLQSRANTERCARQLERVRVCAEFGEADMTTSGFKFSTQKFQDGGDPESAREMPKDAEFSLKT